MKIKRLISFALSAAIAASVPVYAGFDSFSGNSVSTGKTTITVNGGTSKSRYLAAVAKLSENVTEYGFYVNGKEYKAQTELSDGGYYGIQLFGALAETNYTVKPYYKETNGDVVFGSEYTTRYKGTDYCVEDFEEFELNTPDFSGYTQPDTTKNEWTDASGNTYAFNSIPLEITSPATQSTFSYKLNNSAYYITEVEDGVLLINGQNTPVKAESSDVRFEFEPVSSGKLEISYRYKLASRQAGTTPYNFGLFMDGASGIRAGGAQMTQYGKVMIKTRRDQAPANNCTDIVDVNGTAGEAGAILADANDYNWHTIKYTIDMDEKKYQVYFDGIYAGEFSFIVDHNGRTEETATTLSSLSFMNVGGASSASSVSSNGYNFYLDDVKVYQVY